MGKSLLANQHAGTAANKIAAYTGTVAERIAKVNADILDNLMVIEAHKKLLYLNHREFAYAKKLPEFERISNRIADSDDSKLMLKQINDLFGQGISEQRFKHLFNLSKKIKIIEDELFNFLVKKKDYPEEKPGDSPESPPNKA